MDNEVRPHVAALLENQSEKMVAVHFKHRRWRRLNSFLKLEE